MPGSRRKFTFLLAVIGLLSFASVAYLGYELGRYRAGFAMFDVRRAAEAQDDVIARQAQQIDDMERQIAIYETAREIDQETYTQVEENMSELERQIHAQQEELAFYQGIVSPTDGAAGLRIQSFEIQPGFTERDYTLRLLLVQTIVHNERVTGSVVLTLNGQSEGEHTSLDLQSVLETEEEDYDRYRFRYFQALEFEVTLPPGFIAESVDVEVVPSRPSGSPIVQRYDWQA